MQEHPPPPLGQEIYKRQRQPQPCCRRYQKYYPSSIHKNATDIDKKPFLSMKVILELVWEQAATEQTAIDSKNQLMTPKKSSRLNNDVWSLVEWLLFTYHVLEVSEHDSKHLCHVLFGAAKATLCSALKRMVNVILPLIVLTPLLHSKTDPPYLKKCGQMSIFPVTTIFSHKILCKKLKTFFALTETTRTTRKQRRPW